MNSKSKVKVYPAHRLRFPDFAGEWEEKKLFQIATSVTERATAEDAHNVLTLSGEFGLIKQGDYFGKKIAGEITERYIRIIRDDFVYNDRVTKASEYGTIKRLDKYEVGIVSPIYKCFRFNQDENKVFWQYYFESNIHDLELKDFANEGARAGRFNISIDKFLTTSVKRPRLSEQQHIAAALFSLDAVITAQSDKLTALGQHKQGLMQVLFPGKGEGVPRLRFPEFEGIGEWEEDKLGRLGKNLNTYRVPIEQGIRTKGPYPYYGASGIVDYVSEYIFDELLLCISEDGANLVSRVYPIAFSIRGKTWVNNHAHVLKFEDESTHIIVREYLNSIKLDSFLTGMAQPKLNRSMLDSIPIPLPSLPEQQRLAAALSSLNELIAAQVEKVAELKELKRGLMQGLFPRASEE